MKKPYNSIFVFFALFLSSQLHALVLNNDKTTYSYLSWPFEEANWNKTYPKVFHRPWTGAALTGK